MNSKDKELLVKTWVDHHKKGRAMSSSPEDTSWSWVGLKKFVRHDPELAWELILQVLATDQSDVIIENLAAGPLEELLVYHGEKFIERIKKQAEQDSDFNELLGGIWEDDISPEVWNTVQKVRKSVW